jgi:hypothetical protein
MPQPSPTVLAALLLGACTAPKAASTPPRSPTMSAVTIDLERHPALQFRIDSFLVPDRVRGEFEVAMRRNLAFLETLPGYRAHLVFEKTGGPTTFNLVTIAVWDSPQAVEEAGKQVRAYYQKIGFDLPGQLARWGVKAELGNFRALPHPP